MHDNCKAKYQIADEKAVWHTASVMPQLPRREAERQIEKVPL